MRPEHPFASVVGGGEAAAAAAAAAAGGGAHGGRAVIKVFWDIENCHLHEREDRVRCVWWHAAP